MVGSQIEGKDGNLTKIGNYPEPWQAVQSDLSKLGRSDAPIIRLHDSNWLSVNQTKHIIDQVKEKGFKFVNFARCFGLSNGYFEDGKKISPFYGDLPKIGSSAEDEGKIFSGQIRNSATSFGPSGFLLMVTALIALLF
jgi:hypothetical protein